MPTNPAPSQTLPCKECGYANEPERVYCHNCGAKLDRSVLPKEEEVRRESPERARKRIMRMANPASNVVRREVAALFKTLLLAFLTACVIQALRPPEGVPNGKVEMNSRLISSDLYDLTQSIVPKTATFSEGELNTFLRTKVKGKSSVPGVEFNRLFVNLDEGSGRLVIEKSVYGYKMYLGTVYHIEGNDGVVTATNIGGNVGRLAIPAKLMEYVSPMLFGDVFQALKREWTLVQQMQKVTVHKEKVELVGKGRH